MLIDGVLCSEPKDNNSKTRQVADLHCPTPEFNVQEDEHKPLELSKTNY